MGVPIIDSFQTWLTLLAVAAALARSADGQLLIPLWTAAVLQVPALLAWIHRGWGWFGIRKSMASPSDCLFTILVIVGGGAIAARSHNADAFFICTTTYLAGQLLLNLCGAIAQRLEVSLNEPAQLVRALLPAWITCIIVVTILLSLPLATLSSVPDYRHNFWLHISNCAFSSANAASLVGTGVYSFGEDYSNFGRCVLMLTTQFCGMGFAAFGLSIVRPLLLREIKLRTIWTIAAALQVAAALIMIGAWKSSDAVDWVHRIAWGLVHSTSALWNSGYALKSNGLAEYFNDPRVFICITLLAILGSLGLPIVMDLLFPRASIANPRNVNGSLDNFKRLASWEAGLTFFLLLSAALAIFFFETPRFLPQDLIPSRPFEMAGHLVPLRDEQDHGSRFRAAVFVSATLRSAGLQSIPLSLGAVSWPTYFAFLAWMLIGGSVAGTAGGMGTSIIALLAICLFYGPASRDNLQKNPLRWQLFRRLLLFALGWLAFNAIGILVLAATTAGTWYEWSFESVAAANNVGLSTGLSLHLTPAGRLVMIGLMTLGRWWPVIFWARTSALLKLGK